jgi:hypothetical protein
VGEQVAEDLADRAQPLELLEDQADGAAGLLIRIEVEAAGGPRKTSPRRTLLSSPCRIRPWRTCSSASDMIPVSPSNNRSL